MAIDVFFFHGNCIEVVVSRGSNWKIIFQFLMCLCLSGIERIFTFSVATMVDNLKSTRLLPTAMEGKFGKDLKKKLKERSKKFVVVFNGKSTALGSLSKDVFERRTSTGRELKQRRF